MSFFQERLDVNQEFQIGNIYMGALSRRHEE